MEFLRSFLRRHLAGKPVVASPNVQPPPLLGFTLIGVNSTELNRVSKIAPTI